MHTSFIDILKRIPVDLGQGTVAETTEGKQIALRMVRAGHGKRALDVGCRKGSMIVHTRRLNPLTLPFFKKLTSALYYRIFSFFSSVKIESGMADFQLLDRQAVDDILRFGEERLFFRDIVHWVGYRARRWHKSR